MKSKLVLIAVFLLLLVVIGYLFKELRESRSMVQRITSSFQASTSDLEYYKDQNGRLTAKVQVLELKNSELNKIYPEILAEIKDLKINPRHINHYSETVIHHEKEVVRALRDSIILDSLPAKLFTYKDDHYDVSGMIRDDSISMRIASTDSLIQVVYRGRRPRPWLWIFSPRQLEQVIQSSNPNSRIIYSRVIQIQKK